MLYWVLASSVVAFSTRSQWSDWTPCVRCANGADVRCRIYTDAASFNIPECEVCENGESENEWAQFTQWSEWNRCCPSDTFSATRVRKRSCIGGKQCETSEIFESEECSVDWVVVFAKDDGLPRRKIRSEMIQYLPLNFGDLWGNSDRPIPVRPIAEQTRPIAETRTTSMPTTWTSSTSAYAKTTFPPNIPEFDKTATIERVSPNSNIFPLSFPTQSDEKEFIFQFSSNKCPFIGSVSINIFKNRPKSFYTEWSRWTDRCSSGKQYRTRECAHPQFAGVCQRADMEQSRSCNSRTGDLEGKTSDYSYCSNEYLKSFVEICLEHSRCMVFRTWSDDKLSWVTDCFRIWGFNTDNIRTFRWRAKFIHRKSSFS